MLFYTCIESAPGSGDSFYYLPFLNLTGDGVLTIPASDNDDSYAIDLPEPLPLGAANVTYTIAYVSGSCAQQSNNKLPNTQAPTSHELGFSRPEIYISQARLHYYGFNLKSE